MADTDRKMDAASFRTARAIVSRELSSLSNARLKESSHGFEISISRDSHPAAKAPSKRGTAKTVSKK